MLCAGRTCERVRSSYLLYRVVADITHHDHYGNSAIRD